MNRKELDKEKEKLLEEYFSAKIEGYYEGYDFEDYLIRIIDLVQCELKDLHSLLLNREGELI